MKISNSEKLIIMMLCEIFQKLELSKGFNSQFIEAAIGSGNTWAIEFEYSGIDFEDTELPELVSDVFDYIQMWELIEISYSRLTPEEKKSLEESVDYLDKSAKFPGFSELSEAPYLNVAQFIIKEMGRYTLFKDRDLDCHFPVVHQYNRMMEVYNSVNDLSHTNPLDLSQLVAILNARTHPDRR